ncbi:MAG: zinc ribbon domain-containing protein [Thermoplasmata archaeon]|nr:zinc ribbon domain-containing protein [Thermoplasmata archaeon]
MTACPRCGTAAEAGALFCRNCGATVPQESPTGGFPASPSPPPPPLYAPPPPPLPPPPPMPPPEWIPPGLAGRAVHCPRCNNLISAVAVVCPVCLSAQGPRVGAGEGAAPAR